ncbi:PRC-barrel domain-containing protein [Thioalkalivibrio sp. ALMg9]|uniref:PRC-barrel domain-containing protein n=1 Tax=Thioalkalivibrio sp. ALMg9 TaxID=1266912 RepID=UPI00036E6017|nr:PRC-barrel domain-containing protein [Thioalkalivibrio sp. ALMg9]
MKKLYSFALYALVAPAMTLGASSVLAQDQQERTDQDADRGAQSMERDKGDQDYGMEGRADQQAEDRRDAGDEFAERKGYLESAPADGMQASDIMGTDVKTAGDENLGSVDDLIIDENGQVVAIVVGVGGFLGIGEKDVAIGWGHVTTSGTADDRELRVDVTREELRDAPEFERRD